MRTRKIRIVLTVLLFLFIPPRVWGSVFVVDASGGGDFTQIQPAIDASASGDTVLVRAGDYRFQVSQLLIQGKGISLIADGSDVNIDPILIMGIPATNRVVVRGFALVEPWLLGAGISISGASGDVWIEACTAIGAEGLGGWGCTSVPGDPAAVVQSSSSVTFVACRLAGGRGANEFIGGPVGSSSASDGGNGAQVVDSRIAFVSCDVVGGDGGNGDFCSPAGSGGAGASLTNSHTLFSGDFVTGGDGGEAQGDGGTGVVLDVTSTAQVLDTAFVAGSPGSSGQPGDDVDDPGSGVVLFSGPAKQTLFSSPVREGESTVLSFEGVPGDRVLLFSSPSTQQVPFPQAKGWLFLGFPLNGPMLSQLIVSPSGRLDVPLVVPDLPDPTLESVTVHLQAFFLVGSDVTASAPTATTVLDTTL